MTEEIWKPIKGWEWYEVSSLGRVRNGDFVLKQRKNDRGYYVVSLSNKGIGKTLTVHRLVLIAFAGEASDGLECAHLDGNKVNNERSNLDWVPVWKTPGIAFMCTKPSQKRKPTAEQNLNGRMSENFESGFP